MTWVKEQKAAEMVNKKPRTLRKLVLSGKWKINVTAPNGRGYMYCKDGLEKLLRKSSTITR